MKITPKQKVRPLWRKWFAWHPIRIGATWVWLERVERRVDVICDEAFYYYRLPGEADLNRRTFGHIGTDGTIVYEYPEQVMGVPSPTMHFSWRGDDPLYQQIIALFERNGVQAPPTRLRDELVSILDWARFGFKVANASYPGPVEDAA